MGHKAFNSPRLIKVTGTCSAFHGGQTSGENSARPQRESLFFLFFSLFAALKEIPVAVKYAPV